jgi:hypothetical protein
MGDVQATGAIDEDKDSDLALPEVIRPQAVCVLAAENPGINEDQLKTAVADGARQTFSKRLQKEKDLGDLAPQPAFFRLMVILRDFQNCAGQIRLALNEGIQ